MAEKELEKVGITINKNIYSLVCFSQHLDSVDRSDRVIAEKWDTAYSLINGKLDDQELDRLKKNVPLQESGRNSSKELILSRANKSVRLFEYVANCLSNGLQPDINEINKVGYLLRTTAVYGSGKFGLSDFVNTKEVTDFNQPFRAEMLSVYIIREFSVELVEHVAKKQNPSKAVKLEDKIKQHLGIGNSTGLGMAPFIVNHPTLLNNWILSREKVLKKIREIKNVKSHPAADQIAMVTLFTQQLLPVWNLDALSLVRKRVTHNDTKFNNVLLNQLNKGCCVIDLDTVMPGIVHYDFGDGIRSSACTAAEDESDLQWVSLDRNRFFAFKEGYLEAAKDELDATEIQFLPLSGAYMAFIMGLRFLTDYMEGNTYYKIDHPNHNLDRCKNQFKLSQDILHQLNDLK